MIQVYDKYGKIKSSGLPGSGTVTSLSAGDLSPLFNSTVTSPTSTPNVSFSKISQSQNLFYASPNGSSGLPTFRALVAADLPAITGYVPTSRTLTINGVTYDLTADRSWTVTASGTTWGSITGTLTAQTDLTTYLSTNYFPIPTGTISQYIDGTGALQTFPTIPTVGTWGALNYPTWTTGTPFVKMTAAGTFALDTNTYLTSAVTSVGLSMPSAFTVTNSPVTSTGTLTVTGAGLVSQYIRGDGTLANFPASTGGGASLSFYLNGSVSQGTFGGVAFKEMDRTPILGAGTDFTINANGYIQSFITDAGVPNQLEIPAGNWNFETYFSASSGGGSPSFYVELYKWDGTTLSLIASNSANPEGITNGTVTDLYVSALAVPQTTLLATDRLAVRIYVSNSGRTIKLHTEDNHLCQVITTFSTGLTALNGLTAQVQNLAVGTSGTDFAINSTTATHTFNLPTASALNRGALSSSDWITFNGKGNGTVTSVAALTLGTIGTDLSSTVANGTTTPVITLNVPTASASNRGALSSADWTSFNGRKKKVISDTTSVTVTGVTTLTLAKTYEVTAGTLPTSGFLDVFMYSSRTGTNGVHTMGLYINTTNNFATSTLIFTSTSNGSFTPFLSVKMFLLLKNNLLTGTAYNAASGTNLANQTTSISVACNNTSASVWFFVGVTPSSGQTIDFQGIEIIT